MYSMRKTAWQYSELLVFVGLVALAAASGNVFEPGPFYAALHKPAWTPPDDVFAPVWAALYVMIQFVRGAQLIEPFTARE